jgi:hypothetical protein
VEPTIDELYEELAPPVHGLKCHFCARDLHENNNAMTRAMAGQEPGARGFGWISVIVEPFAEVPCCDICMEDKNLPGLVMV